MYKKIAVVAALIMAVAIIGAAAASAQMGQGAPGKPPEGKPMPHHKLANMVAVCGCGMVFVPGPNTKTITYEGKEYACCSDACHEKMAAMKPADAAKLCEDQMKKLENPKGTAGKK